MAAVRDTFVAAMLATWPLLALYILAQRIDMRTLRDERDAARVAKDAADKGRRQAEAERDAVVERNAYLTERNMQLTYDLLARNVGKFIKVSKN